MTREEYQRYLQTPGWKVRRKAALDLFEYKCGLNKSHTKGLNVHHNNYDHLGGELPVRDLIVLCRACHAKHHNELPKIEDQGPFIELSREQAIDILYRQGVA